MRVAGFAGGPPCVAAYGLICSRRAGLPPRAVGGNLGGGAVGSSFASARGAGHEGTSHGELWVKSVFIRACVKLRGLFRYPRSEVRAQLRDAARFRARSTSHTVAARDGCTNIPLAAGRGSGDETILSIGMSGHGYRRFVHPDPPELIRSWEI